MVNFKKTLKKAGVVMLCGAITGLVGWLTSLPIDPTQTIYVTIAVSILASVQDVIKHWCD